MILIGSFSSLERHKSSEKCALLHESVLYNIHDIHKLVLWSILETNESVPWNILKTHVESLTKLDDDPKYFLVFFLFLTLFYFNSITSSF